jgi:hypothetical protein
MAAPRLKRWLRWIAVGAFVVFISLQFMTVERTNPPVESDLEAPADVMQVLRRACYDCHSHETRWPWYSHVAPVSWYMVNHVDDARGDLNFSRWPSFDFESQAYALEDIREQVATGEMPLTSYTLMHPRARLDEEDRDLLLRWAAGGR